METDGSALAMRSKKIEAFLRKPIIAVLSWTTRSGEPMMTPVWYQYQDGKFLIYTTLATAKARALQRTGRACLCIQYSSPPHRYVTVRGDARIIRDQELAGRLMERLARRYLGRLGSRRFLQLAEKNQQERVIIEVTPTEMRSLDTVAVVNPIVVAAWSLLRRIPGL